MKRILLIIVLFLGIYLFAQKSNYDYTVTIKVEGKSLEESIRIKNELIKYCEKNNISIEDYSKKEFNEIQKSRNLKIFR